MVRTIVIPRHPRSALQARELADIDEFERVTGGWVRAHELERLSTTIWVNQAAVVRRGGFNARATALAWHYSMPGRDLPIVLGDVVLTGPVNDPVLGMDATPLVEQSLLEPLHFVIQLSAKNEEQWRDSHVCFDNIFDAAIWCMLLGLTQRREWDVRINPDDPHGDRCDHSPFRAAV